MTHMFNVWQGGQLKSPASTVGTGILQEVTLTSNKQLVGKEIRHPIKNIQKASSKMRSKEDEEINKKDVIGVDEFDEEDEGLAKIKWIDF